MADGPDSYLVLDSLVDKYLFLSRSAPEDVRLLDSELGARARQGGDVAAADLALVEGVAAGRPPADAAARAGLLPRLVREALDHVLAEPVDSAESGPLRARVASGHGADEEGGTLWRQARLRAELA